MSDENAWTAPSDAGPRTVFGFVPQFWVINFVELLERLAYYGSVSFLSLYLLALGYEGGIVGIVLAIWLPLPYIVGIIGGTLGDRFGYRSMSAVAFVFYLVGFAMLGSFTQLNAMGVGMLLVAVGAGLFKALPAAAVTHLTDEDRRGLGFTIYYWAINVGAFVGPVVIAYLLIGDTSDGDLSGYRHAFWFAAVMMAVNIAVTLILFRNPRAPNRDASVWESVKPLLLVFTDLRFVLIMVAYSGFWALYSMNFSFLAPYLADFVELPSWFAASSQQAVNPLTIILFGVPLGALAGRWESMRRMGIGIALYVVGFVIIGFTGTFYGFIAGIIVATVGEVLTHPGYLAFVGHIAPKDRVAIYQSVGFLPIAIGLSIGPSVGGVLYERLATAAGRTELFWAIMVAFALVALTGFILVAGFTGERKRPVRTGLGAFVPLAVAGLLILTGAAFAGTPVAQPAELPTGVDVTYGPWDDPTLTEGGQPWKETVPVQAADGELIVTVTWSDQAQSGTQGTVPTTNLPDTVFVQILDENGTVLKESAHETGGSIELHFTQATGMARNVTIAVTMEDAGDYTLAGQTVGADTGNAVHIEAGFKAAEPVAPDDGQATSA